MGRISLFGVVLAIAQISWAAPLQGASPSAKQAPEPKIETRAKQFYVAIRSEVSLGELKSTIPSDVQEVFRWLKEKGIEPAGIPFTRFMVVDMPNRFDIEIGVPVSKQIDGDDRVHGGSFPAGRYVVYVYTGEPTGLVGANAFAQTWAHEEGVKLDRTNTKDGIVWAARAERYLFNPLEQPDQSKWKTEIDYLIAAQG